MYILFVKLAACICFDSVRHFQVLPWYCLGADVLSFTDQKFSRVNTVSAPNTCALYVHVTVVPKHAHSCVCCMFWFVSLCFMTSFYTLF